ncbi:hypothetical protein [Paraburkholderia sp. GAS42]|uniref:hypothetical protein n=1 Tax=Paraburkholderia sp. GAS42 TaxID=3035135 RepID=UPI003D22A519
MTVSELIEHLRAFPADACVVVPLQEGRGYAALRRLLAVPVRRVAPGTPIDGEYLNELDLMYEAMPFVPDETAVVIEWE